MFVDEDEGAGDAVLAVGVGAEGCGGAEGDAADVVEGEDGVVLDFVKKGSAREI